MAYSFLPRNYKKESLITSCCHILPSFYYPTNRFRIQTYKGNHMGPNITPKQCAHLNLVLDEVNHAYLALSKSSVKPTSCSLTIWATSYSPASIGGSEKNNCSTATSQNPHTHSHHKSAITSCHLATVSCSVNSIAVACEGQVIQPSSVSSGGKYLSNSPQSTVGLWKIN